MVLVEVAFDLDRRPIVVAVDPLALIALIGDEMARAEDQVVLGDADLEDGDDMAGYSFLYSDLSRDVVEEVLNLLEECVPVDRFVIGLQRLIAVFDRERIQVH